MRFIVIVKASKESEAGTMPTEQELRDMGNFNDELVNKGVMLAGEGLRPSSQGVRVQFDGGSRSVVDGPFAETKELVAGFWILQCRSKAECIEWMRRCPNPFAGAGDEGEVEIRQIFEAEDFAPAAGRAAR